MSDRNSLQRIQSNYESSLKSVIALNEMLLAKKDDHRKVLEEYQKARLIAKESENAKFYPLVMIDVLEFLSDKKTKELRMVIGLLPHFFKKNVFL